LKTGFWIKYPNPIDKKGGHIMPPRRTSVRRGNNGNLIFRSEWRVTSEFRPPRTESYDISFSPRQLVHRDLSDKLEHAARQLQQHTLRFGEALELSKVYFIGRE
jgi:hypothetical protein